MQHKNNTKNEKRKTFNEATQNCLKGRMWCRRYLWRERGEVTKCSNQLQLTTEYPGGNEFC